MLAKRLKSLRESKNITQKELANKLGISPSAIGMYESGKRNPDTSMLNILSNFFDVSVDYLMGRSDIKSSADEVLKENHEETIALHSDYDYKDLPDEARKEIENYIEYIKQKYKK